jgi:hypothetical protein
MNEPLVYLFNYNVISGIKTCMHVEQKSINVEQMGLRENAYHCLKQITYPRGSISPISLSLNQMIQKSLQEFIIKYILAVCQFLHSIIYESDNSHVKG